MIATNLYNKKYVLLKFKVVLVSIIIEDEGPPLPLWYNATSTAMMHINSTEILWWNDYRLRISDLVGFLSCWYSFLSRYSTIHFGERKIHFYWLVVCSYNFILLRSHSYPKSWQTRNRNRLTSLSLSLSSILIITLQAWKFKAHPQFCGTGLGVMDLRRDTCLKNN